MDNSTIIIAHKHKTEQSTEMILDTDTDRYEHKRRLILSTPFISKRTVTYGLIVYAMDSKRWLIVQRTHTIEFMLFIRGAYRITLLPIYLAAITVEEAATIRQCLEDEAFFIAMYTTQLSLPSDGLSYALIRLREVRDLIPKLLTTLNLSDNVIDWGFPKGRMQFTVERELPLACARREFITETEVQLPEALFVSGDYVSETIKTLTNRIIESRYWIYIVAEEFKLPDRITNLDINDRQWADDEQCQRLTGDSTLFQRVSQLVKDIQ